MRKLLLICLILSGCATQPELPDDDPYPYYNGDMAVLEIQGVI